MIVLREKKFAWWESEYDARQWGEKHGWKDWKSRMQAEQRRQRANFAKKNGATSVTDSEWKNYLNRKSAYQSARSDISNAKNAGDRLSDYSRQRSGLRTIESYLENHPDATVNDLRQVFSNSDLKTHDKDVAKILDSRWNRFDGRGLETIESTNIGNPGEALPTTGKRTVFGKNSQGKLVASAEAVHGNVKGQDFFNAVKADHTAWDTKYNLGLDTKVTDLGRNEVHEALNANRERVKTAEENTRQVLRDYKKNGLDVHGQEVRNRVSNEAAAKAAKAKAEAEARAKAEAEAKAKAEAARRAKNNLNATRNSGFSGSGGGSYSSGGGGSYSSGGGGRRIVSSTIRNTSASAPKANPSWFSRSKNRRNALLMGAGAAATLGAGALMLSDN